MSFSLRNIRRFIDAESDIPSTSAINAYYKMLQQSFGTRAQNWHANVIQNLRSDHDVLIRAPKDSDKSLIYQALAQLKPSAIVLVISQSLEMMEIQVHALPRRR